MVKDINDISNRISLFEIFKCFSVAFNIEDVSERLLKIFLCFLL